jgi:DNA-directed RNA polymerase subunit M/transcription elongation factor TFIIS
MIEVEQQGELDKGRESTEFVANKTTEGQGGALSTPAETDEIKMLRIEQGAFDEGREPAEFLEIKTNTEEQVGALSTPETDNTQMSKMEHGEFDEGREPAEWAEFLEIVTSGGQGALSTPETDDTQILRMVQEPMEIDDKEADGDGGCAVEMIKIGEGGQEAVSIDGNEMNGNGPKSLPKADGDLNGKSLNNGTDDGSVIKYPVLSLGWTTDETGEQTDKTETGVGNGVGQSNVSDRWKIVDENGELEINETRSQSSNVDDTAGDDTKVANVVNGNGAPLTEPMGQEVDGAMKIPVSYESGSVGAIPTPDVEGLEGRSNETENEVATNSSGDLGTAAEPKRRRTDNDSDVSAVTEFSSTGNTITTIVPYPTSSSTSSTASSSTPSGSLSSSRSRRCATHTCPKCGERFESFNSLKWHEIGHDLPKKSKMFECVECGNSYSTLVRYQKHLQLHKECLLCGTKIMAKDKEYLERNGLTVNTCRSCVDADNLASRNETGLRFRGNGGQMGDMSTQQGIETCVDLSNFT